MIKQEFLTDELVNHHGYTDQSDENHSYPLYANGSIRIAFTFADTVVFTAEDDHMLAEISQNHLDTELLIKLAGLFTEVADRAAA